jgi:hypothetical protein
MRGVGVDKGGGGITSSANVIDCFCIPITTRGEGSGIGPKNGRSGIRSVKDAKGSGLGIGGGRQGAYWEGGMEEDGEMKMR